MDKTITNKTWEAMYGASYILVTNLTPVEDQP
jgi:hypothetical protein